MFSIENFLSVGDVFQKIWERKLADHADDDISFEILREKAFSEFTDFLGFCESAVAVSPSGTQFRVSKYFLDKTLPDNTEHWYFSYETGLVRSLEGSIFDESEPDKINNGLTDRLSGFLHFNILALLYFVLPSLSIGFGLAILLDTFHNVFFRTVLLIDCSPNCLERDSIRDVFYAYFLPVINFTASTLLIYVGVFLMKKNLKGMHTPRINFAGFEGYSINFSEDSLKLFYGLEDYQDTQTKGSETSVANDIIKLFDQKVQFKKSEARMYFGGHLTSRGFGRAWELARSKRPELGKPGRKSRAT